MIDINTTYVDLGHDSATSRLLQPHGFSKNNSPERVQESCCRSYVQGKDLQSREDTVRMPISMIC